MLAAACLTIAAATSGCWFLDVDVPQHTASVEPSPFIPTAWELRPIVLPPDHSRGVIMDVSPDGSQVVFRDADLYDPIYLLNGSRVKALVPPDHVQGAPIGSQMFTDGRRLLIGELADAWVYSIASGEFELVPDAPEGGGMYVLTDDRIGALTGSVASHEFGGVTDSKLWLLDSAMTAWSALGTRTDGISMIPMTNAVGLLTDLSPDHDNSHWIWYRINFDGSESVIHDFDGPPGCFALALDGTHVAVTKAGGQDGGTWLVDVATGAERLISDGCAISFSPDGLQVAMYFGDGHTEAVTLHGEVVASIASSQIGWIGVP
jgi:hypothetical protein